MTTRPQNPAALTEVLSLGEAVRLLRNIGGMTQIQIARKVKVKRDAIAKWEAGHHLPKPENLTVLAELAAELHLELSKQGENARAEQALRLASFFRESREESRVGHNLASAFVDAIRRARRGDAVAKALIALLFKTEADLNSFFQTKFVEVQEVLDAEEKKKATSRLLDQVHNVRMLRDGLFYFIGRSRSALHRELKRFGNFYSNELLEIERLIASRFLDHEADVGLVEGAQESRIFPRRTAKEFSEWLRNHRGMNK